MHPHGYFPPPTNIQILKNKTNIKFCNHYTVQGWMLSNRLFSEIMVIDKLLTNIEFSNFNYLRKFQTIDWQDMRVLIKALKTLTIWKSEAIKNHLQNDNISVRTGRKYYRLMQWKRQSRPRGKPLYRMIISMHWKIAIYKPFRLWYNGKWGKTWPRPNERKRKSLTKLFFRFRVLSLTKENFRFRTLSLYFFKTSVIMDSEGRHMLLLGNFSAVWPSVWPSVRPSVCPALMFPKAQKAFKGRFPSIWEHLSPVWYGYMVKALRGPCRALQTS